MRNLLHRLIRPIAARRDLTRWQSVAVVAAIIAIVLSGALFFVGRLNSQIAQEARDRLNAFVDQQAAGVDDLLRGASSDIRLARQNPVFEAEILATSAAVPPTERAQIEGAIRYMGERYAVDEICLIRADGGEIARFNDGQIAPLDRLSTDESIANPAFLPAMQLADDSVYITDPYVSPDSARWVYGFATPIVLQGGHRAGILHFEIPIEGIAAQLDSATFAPTAFTFMLQRDGSLLAHPQLAAFRAAAGIPDGPGAPFPPASAAGGESWGQAVTNMLNYGDGATTFEADGAKFSVAYRATNGGADIVGTVVPDDVLFADVQRARTDLAVTLGPLVLVMLVISAWFASRLRGAHVRLTASNRASGQLAAIVVAADDAIVRTDLDGRVVTWNRGAERMYGFTEEQAVGTNLSALVAPERGTEIERLLASVAQGEPVERHETLHVRRDKSKVDVAITLSPIRDETGLVSACSVVVRDISGRKQLERELSHQALHDSLTGLPNRPLFLDRLAHALESARRRSGKDARKVAVLFIDVDDFKVINDSLGHRVGDELLRGIASRLSMAIRPGDTCSRLGGDEFTVLLENIVDEHNAERTARRLLKRFAAPFELDGHRIVVSISIGIALSGETTDADEVLRKADLAMYDAKGRGKARYAVFDQSMDDRVWERLQLESELRTAIAAGQLAVHYQPIFELSNGAVHSIEALVRWNHPRRGWVMPDDFIPLAEQTGLILPIGDFVLTAACAQMKSLEATGHGGQLTMSVNVSPRQLREPTFVDHVSRVLKESELHPSKLQLEITEGLLQEDEACLATVVQLRTLGVHVALDDFGTGYSSLGSLRRLPIDSLKIDRSFVSGSEETDQDEAIVTAAVGFAAAVGLEITAEGIETSEQLLAIQKLGCRYGQGFFLAEPLPADELAVLLTATAESVAADAKKHARLPSGRRNGAAVAWSPNRAPA